jgi:hypothetical protein
MPEMPFTAPSNDTPPTWTPPTDDDVTGWTAGLFGSLHPTPSVGSTPAQSHRPQGVDVLDLITAGAVGAVDECTSSPVNGSGGGDMQVGNVLVPLPAQQYLSPEQEQQQSQSGQQQGQSVVRLLFPSSAERDTLIDIAPAPAPAALTTTTTTTVSANNQISNTNALLPGGGSWKQNGQTGEGKSSGVVGTSTTGTPHSTPVSTPLSSPHPLTAADTAGSHEVLSPTSAEDALVLEHVLTKVLRATAKSNIRLALFSVGVTTMTDFLELNQADLEGISFDSPAPTDDDPQAVTKKKLTLVEVNRVVDSRNQMLI